MITVGEILKQKRESIEKSIEQVALDTKIQPRFIRYLENNDFDKFDSPIYTQGFIKVYSKYLDLDENRILAIYRRSVPEIKEKIKNKRETENLNKKIKITPKFIAISLSVVFMLGILTYIGYQIYQFQSPPKINITSPENELSVEENSIEVLGTTDINSSLFINDTPVELDSKGTFQYQVDLNPGVNLITILAKKKNSTQETVETLKINYTIPETESVDEENEIEKPNIVKLETRNSSVWIQLNIDKVNKISQIVQSGQKYEYEVKEEFSLTTGIINSTKIYFNNEEVPIKKDTNNIGSVNCEVIENNQINCQ